MYTVNENIKKEMTINKSKFITYLLRIDNVYQVKQELDSIKDIWKDATHYCYAYIIDDIRKSSDDGEPSGTAGIPIMEVLNKNNLNYILCVVVRYFGGIKLGAGGLVRAYAKSASEIIRNASLKEIVDGYKIILDVKYEEETKINRILKDCNYECQYKEYITYIIQCDKKTKDILFSIYNIKEYSEIKIIK